MSLVIAPLADGVISITDSMHIAGYYGGISPQAGLQTDFLHIFSEGVIEPNHISDSGNNVLTAGDTEVQGTGHFGKIDMHDNEITNVNFIDFDLVNGVAAAEGRMVWNDDDGTLNIGQKGGVVNLQVGQEMLIRVKNGLGVQIDNGQPVYISGADGANIVVGLADADFATGVGFRTIAVATEDILAGQNGYVTTAGFVRDFDTDSFFAEGVPLYLASGGGFTETPPTAPDVTVFCAILTRKSATVGEIYVSITSVPNLNSLSDVQNSVADNDILQWDEATNTWDNTQNPTVKTTRIINTDSPYTVLASDHEIFCDTDTGAITVNLPAGINGTRYIIHNVGTSGNIVTLHPNGADLLFGLNEDYIILDRGDDEQVTYETTEGWG